MRAARPIALLFFASAAAFAQGEARYSCSVAGEKPSVAASVVDARGGIALENALVAVDWDDLMVYHKTLRTSHHQAKTRTDNSGQFSLCGLPTESPLMLRISANGFRGIETEFALPAGGMLSHIFRLPEEGITTGPGTIRARVVDDTGRSMVIGRGTIASLGRRVDI